MQLISSPLHSEKRFIYHAEVRREPDDTGGRTPVVYLEGRPLDTLDWAINDFEIMRASIDEIQMLKEGGYWLPVPCDAIIDFERSLVYQN